MKIPIPLNYRENCYYYRVIEIKHMKGVNKMSHIMLVNTPHTNTVTNTRFEENFGILYLEASLKKAGYDCYIIDGMAYNLSYDKVLEEILNNIPSVFIGFSAYGYNINQTVRLIRDLRKKGIKKHIIIGGMWASFKYREILSQVKEVDSVCVGEGEDLIVELSDAISRGIDLSLISGLATRNKNNSIVFTPRKFRDNLDALPVPDRRGYYFDLIKNKDYAAIFFSRGCHGRCTFCNIASYIKMCGGSPWRPRSPIAVADEIEYIINTTGVKSFDFIDDNFPGPNEKEREKCFLLAEEIIKRKLDIKFFIGCRVEGINSSLFEKLKEAGLTVVYLGVESWANYQLKRYNKKITVERALKAIKILDKLGINYFYYLLPFDPYVTREEIEENLTMVGKIGLEKIDFVSFCQKLYLNQYQPLFKKCYKDNLIRDFCPADLDNYKINYSQFYSEVKGIVEAGDTLAKLFYKILIKLRLTGKEKRIPVYQWTRVEKEILLAFKEKLYEYLREYFYSGKNDGACEFMRTKASKTCDNIYYFAEKITGKDIIEFKEHIIDIDGIKISTRPKGFNELISHIMKEDAIN
jgi:radical SAM superfamily enzyme YgiQ (UPF0313 family)